MLQSRSSSPDRGPVATTDPPQPAPRLPRRPQRHPRSRLWKDGLNWTRILHVYTSMVALLLVLFFGVTGITLNHPDWTFGLDPVSADYAGTLPEEWIGDDGTIQFLAVSEYLRDAYDVDGEVVDFGSDATDGYISYREPGYSADVFFDLTSGDYRLNVEQQGFIGVLNELHKGRDTGSPWSWVIDLSGAFLVLIALTGLGLQLFLTKRRRAALLWALAGIVLAVTFIWVAVA